MSDDELYSDEELFSSLHKGASHPRTIPNRQNPIKVSDRPSLPKPHKKKKKRKAPKKVRGDSDSDSDYAALSGSDAATDDYGGSSGDGSDHDDGSEHGKSAKDSGTEESDEEEKKYPERKKLEKAFDAAKSYKTPLKLGQRPPRRHSPFQAKSDDELEGLLAPFGRSKYQTPLSKAAKGSLTTDELIRKHKEKIEKLLTPPGSRSGTAKGAKKNVEVEDEVEDEAPATVIKKKADKSDPFNSHAVQPMGGAAAAPAQPAPSTAATATPATPQKKSVLQRMAETGGKLHAAAQSFMRSPSAALASASASAKAMAVKTSNDAVTDSLKGLGVQPVTIKEKIDKLMAHVAPRQAALKIKIEKLEAKRLTQEKVVADAKVQLEAVKKSKAPHHERLMATMMANSRMAEANDRINALLKEIEDNKKHAEELMQPVSKLQEREANRQALHASRLEYPDIPQESEAEEPETEIDLPKEDSLKSWTSFLESTHAYDVIDDLTTHPHVDLQHKLMSFGEFQQQHNARDLHATLMRAAHAYLDRVNIPHAQFGNVMIKTERDFDAAMRAAYDAYVSKYEKMDRRTTKASRKLQDIEEEREETRSARKAKKEKQSAASSSSAPSPDSEEEDGVDYNTDAEIDMLAVDHEVSEDERDEEQQSRSTLRSDLMTVDSKTLKASGPLELSALSQKLLKDSKYTAATAIATLKRMDEELLAETKKGKGRLRITAWKFHDGTGKITKGGGKSTYARMHKRIEEVIETLKHPAKSKKK